MSVITHTERRFGGQGRVIYNLSPYEAEELAMILEQKRGDEGWKADSRTLLEEALKARGGLTDE